MACPCPPRPAPGSLIVETSSGHISVPLVPGAVILDACCGQDEPIPYCCRSAGCGTCRVEVLSGAEHLSPPAEAELDVLDIYRADPARVRLACQARAMSGAVVIRVRPLGA